MSGWEPPPYDPQRHQERMYSAQQPPSQPPEPPQQPTWPPQQPTWPPQQPPPRKSWPARHKVLSGLIALGVLGIIGGAAGAAGNDGNAHTVATTSAKAAGNSCQAGMSPDVNGVCQPGGVAPSAPESTDAAAPSDSGPAMLSPGDSEQVGYSNSVAATITVESARVTTSPADPEFGEPPANGYYVIVHVKATCDPSYTDGFDVNELDFYALANGSHYDSTSGNGYEALTQAQQGQDLTANLAAGESSSGWLAFDVPSRHGEIVYSPNLNSQPLAEWKY